MNLKIMINCVLIFCLVLFFASNVSAANESEFNFFISAFVEGAEYSLELFEFLLGANSGAGSEYSANLTLDEQSTPNNIAQGSEYTLSVGGYGLLSSPPGTTSVVAISCGDSICNGDETCSSCSSDCGACAEEEVVSSGGGGSGDCQKNYSKVDGKCILIKNETIEEPITIEDIVEEPEELEADDEEPLEEERLGITGQIIEEGIERGPIWGVGAFVLFLIIVLVRYLIIKNRLRTIRKKEHVYKKQFDKIKKIKNPRIKYKKSKFKILNKISKLSK